MLLGSYMKHTLLLASQSSSRKRLLQEMGIPFQVISQSADEYACNWALPLEQLVQSIAIHKMESLLFSDEPENYTRGHDRLMRVLTADTLGQDSSGRLLAKPSDYSDAVAQLKAQNNRWVTTATGFCLERKVLKNGSWQCQERIAQTVVAETLFSIEDAEISEYIEAVGARNCAGSLSIDGFGGQYLKEIRGSYSCVIGLPLFELRQALKKTGFFTI